ncbi:unnamed protein product [Rotaria sp. Silwood2]|nr:unnamed protein product [Rotaria sp. Silwood2]
MDTRDYPMNIHIPISTNIRQLTGKKYSFLISYQLKIWTATNYTKNKNCLIKASSELINSNQRRKIPQADLVSLRLTIQEESITKLISSSSNSTATNESSISKKTSSITSVENVQFILHINEQKKTSFTFNLSSITCHPHRKQKDLISTSVSIPLTTITTINNTTRVDNKEDEYYEDDIEQIESTTPVQQSNPINKNKNITNSNFS